jgi:hypothetical protein
MIAEFEPEGRRSAVIASASPLSRKVVLRCVTAVMLEVVGKLDLQVKNP